MALNAAAQTAAGNGLSAVITHLAIHTATPDAAGSNPSTAARVAVTWTNTAGDLSSGSKNFTGGGVRPRHPRRPVGRPDRRHLLRLVCLDRRPDHLQPVGGALTLTNYDPEA